METWELIKKYGNIEMWKLVDEDNEMNVIKGELCEVKMRLMSLMESTDNEIWVLRERVKKLEDLEETKE